MAKATPPRGNCVGCSLEYALYQGADEFKGQLVIRKHLSRVGPGECKGSKRPPLNGQIRADGRTPKQQAEMDRRRENPVAAALESLGDPFTSPAPVAEGDVSDDAQRGPWMLAGYNGDCNGTCGGSILEGDEIRADGEGGWLCTDCGTDEPARVETRKPHVHRYEDADDGNGHSGSVCIGCGEMEPVVITPRMVQDAMSVIGSDAPGDVQNAAEAILSMAADQDPFMTQFMASTGIVSGDSSRDQHRKAAAVYGCQSSKPCADCSSPFLAELAAAVQDPGTVMGPTPDAAVIRPVPAPTQPDPFTAPGAASDIPESSTTVSGQPKPDRDRWRRYLIHGQAHTRATTFAKMGSNTFAIGQWHERNVIVGLTRRPDLLALAEGLEVKRDRDQLNEISEQAKDAAGQKISANLGTAYHAFTERLDAGLITLADVPEKYRARVQQYAETVRNAGLTTRPEWIERTTAVTADMVSAPVPVAGTLDRIFRLPDGSLVIGDLKTGADLSYGMAEIEVQLALYAHGVNTFGMFDWNTKRWQGLGEPVRTDMGIVIHLPADGTGCELIRVDLERGWERARLRGQIQFDQKARSHPQTLTRADLAPRPAPVHRGEVAEYLAAAVPAPDPWDTPHMARARELILAAPDKPTIAGLFQYALESGKFSAPELELMKSLGMKRLRDLGLM